MTDAPAREYVRKVHVMHAKLSSRRAVGPAFAGQGFTGGDDFGIEIGEREQRALTDSLWLCGWLLSR